MDRPTPKQTAPNLDISLLNGQQWRLHQQSSKSFTLLVFYRGLHCPLCEKYLRQLEVLLPEFEKKGVTVVAISMDSLKRAKISQQNWELSRLTLGYNLPLEMAKNWGLFISQKAKEGEPDLFSEPGLFLVDADYKIYYASMNSNPWGRPYLPSFVKAVDYIIASGYPARGEVL